MARQLLLLSRKEFELFKLESERGTSSGVDTPAVFRNQRKELDVTPHSSGASAGQSSFVKR